MNAETPTETESVDATCPECGQHPVTLVTVGDLKAAAPAETRKTAEATITISTTLTFLNCGRCEHSWHLPTKGAA